MNRLMRTLLPACAALALLLGGQQPVAAPPTKVVVESATPSTGEQGTTELDVTITGSGFDSSAAVTFLVSGSTSDTGGVTVTSVEHVNSTTLRAKVNLQNAKIADFDVMVRLSSGRNGKGTTLFKVVAKGGGSGGGDSVAPAPISDLSVQQTIYALALRFTATGDDGDAGTAAKYDVRYRAEGGQGCADSPESWAIANRSSTTTPYAAGTESVFAIRPLDPGAPYCVAIRVGDEASNFSPWTSASSETLDAGTWTRTDWASSTADPFRVVHNLGSVVLGAGGPVAGWRIDQYPIAVFAGDGWQREVDLRGSFQSVSPWSLRVAAVPDSIDTPIAAVMAGVADASGTRSYLLIEGAGPSNSQVTVTEIARSNKLVAGALDAGPDSAITFVPGSSGAWNPVVALDRVESITKQSKTTSLRVAERKSSGQWTETPVLYRTGTGITVSSGYFNRIQMITKPSGALGLLVEHCKITVYAERSPSGDWSYFDAGALMPYANLPLLALDGSGAAMLVSRSDVGTEVNGALLIAREAGFVPLSAAPPAICADTAPSSVAADFWEQVIVADDPLGGGGWYPRGITEVGGAVFIAAQKRAEQRIVYRCHEGDQWNIQNVTRIDQAGSMFSTPVLDPDANTLTAYSWSHYGTANGPWIDQVHLAKSAGNACGVSAQPGS